MSAISVLQRLVSTQRAQRFRRDRRDDLPKLSHYQLPLSLESCWWPQRATPLAITFYAKRLQGIILFFIKLTAHRKPFQGDEKLRCFPGFSNPGLKLANAFGVFQTKPLLCDERY